MFPSTKLIAVVAVLAAAPAAAPAADQAGVPAPQLHEGDSWAFEETIEHGPGFVEHHKDLRIQSVDSDTMLVGVRLDGAPANFQDHLLGSDWSQRRTIDGKDVVTGRPFSFPLAVGKTWTVDFVDSTPHGAEQSAHIQATYRVVGWEDVTTPAGAFHALKISVLNSVDMHMAASASAVGGAAVTTGAGSTVSHVQRLPERNVHETVREQLLYVPQVKYFVKRVTDRYNADEVRISRDSESLSSYTVQP